VFLQYLDGVAHTRGERWIVKNPRGDFNEFVDALIIDWSVSGMKFMMFNLCTCFKRT